MKKQKGNNNASVSGNTMEENKPERGERKKRDDGKDLLIPFLYVVARKKRTWNLKESEKKENKKKKNFSTGFRFVYCFAYFSDFVESYAI